MRFLVLVTLLSVLSVNCKSAKCLDLVCPAVIIPPLRIQFKNSSGNAVTIRNFSAVIRKTGRPTLASLENMNPVNGFYMVISDSDKNILDNDGDFIDVSASHPTKNETKTVVYVVAGGNCKCGIQKISGPEEVVFD